MAGPLAGVRVLELATVVLGPLACQLLGDQGADVVKVEPPGGDSNRQVGPMRSPDMGALFLNCNRNKRGVVLDLKHPQGREAALRLAARADVLVHNYRPAALARLRPRSTTTCARSTPASSTAAPTGTGAPGPTATGRPTTTRSRRPPGSRRSRPTAAASRASCPTILADKTTALAVVAAVNAALFHRARTGEGQEIEVPMFETLVSFVMTEHLWGAHVRARRRARGLRAPALPRAPPAAHARRAPLGAAVPRRALARVLPRGRAATTCWTTGASRACSRAWRTSTRST